MSGPNLDLPGLFGGGPRPSQRRGVRYPHFPKPCRHCRDSIVWTETPGGSRMPLSWKSREPWIEAGKQVGFTMEPHFSNCPNWPKPGRRKP